MGSISTTPPGISESSVLEAGETRTRVIAVAVVVASLCIFAADLLGPLGVADWLPYTVVVLLSLWLPRPLYAYLTVAGCSLLTLVGLFLSPPGLEFPLAASNRAAGVLVFWTIAAVGLEARRIRDVQRANLALREEIQRRKRLEAQFLRAQRLESIGVLTGGIAHNFNNLLTPILMATRLLQEDRPAEQRQMLCGTLQSSVDRAAELVRKLLAFAGGLDGERKSVSIDDVVAETAEIVRHTFPKSIEVETCVTTDLPTVWGDATQLSQVLMNLCVNARDAMPSGGKLSITADRADADDPHLRAHPRSWARAFVRLRVEDTGVGMDAEVLDRMFDPFFSTKDMDGTGLGLSTVLGIVHGHGGFLHVESEAGQGSLFTVYLPAHADPVENLALAANGETLEGDCELVLVVDDEYLTRQAVAAALRSRGYRVVTAGNGAEALEIFGRERGEIRAVVLDMIMPGMDGLTVMARLREMEPKLRIVANSGLGMDGHTAQILADGGVPFLRKPYSGDQLAATLAKTQALTGAEEEK